MRARNLKPGFFKNEALAECSPFARLLFAGLWCLADRKGRLEDRPKRIRAELLPYDDGSVDDLLTELHKAGFILRYATSGGRFIQVVNFVKHQNPHHREADSTIPAPGEPEASLGLSLDKPETSPELAVLIPDSGFLIPDSKTLAQPAARKQTGPTGFSEFWTAYPKKRNKGDAEKAWKAIKPDGELLARIMASLTLAKSSPDWLKEGGQFIPYPASWLRAKGWEDEHQQPPQPAQQQPATTPEDARRSRDLAALRYAVQEFRETVWPEGMDKFRRQQAAGLQASADRLGIKFERPLIEEASA